MSLPQRQEALRLSTAEALRGGASAPPSSNGHPLPGALFAFPETADLAVEWAVLAVEEDGRLLVVPADTNPLRGSSDVTVADTAAAGPLSLRCAFGLSLPAGAFATGRRTGALAPGDVETACCKRQAVAAGPLRGDSLGREVDADPEYEDWVEDILTPAHDALAKRSAEAPSPAITPFVRQARVPTRPMLQHLALAASLVLSVGLGLWALSLYRERADLRQPTEVAYDEVFFFETLRGVTTVAIPAHNQRFVLTLRFSGAPYFPTYTIEVLGPDGELLWMAEREGQSDVTIDFLRSTLTDGIYKLRVFGEQADGQRKLLDKQELQIVTP